MSEVSGSRDLLPLCMDSKVSLKMFYILRLYSHVILLDPLHEDVRRETGVILR